jgi:hypothetical protein
MAFLDESTALLRRTPSVLDALLRGLPEAWTLADEGVATWCPYEVVGHLIHTERVDWIPRLRIILEHGLSRPFDPVDREAMKRAGRERPLPDLLDEFRALREASLHALEQLGLDEAALGREGMHPSLGPVTARQLIATWTAHDQAHIVQISRTFANRYREEVGPWAAFLSVMRPPPTPAT